MTSISVGKFKEQKPSFVLLSIMGLIFLITISAISAQISQYRNMMIEDRKQKTRSLVESAYTLMDHYYKRALSGELTEEEAKKRVLENIRYMRYDDGEYFWINDMNCVMIMHPVKAELENRDLSDFTDSKGKKLIAEFVDVVKKNGEGYVSYYWPKPLEPKGTSHPKISFVKSFVPWGYIIGSGIYIDDVDQVFWESVWTMGILSLIVLIFMSGLAYSTVRSIIRLEQRIIEQKELENQLQRYICEVEMSQTQAMKAKKMAEKASEAKSDFLANMSHEIRTPMNGVLGMLRLILDTHLTLQQREWTRVAHQSAEDLLDIINDILDVSKIESGKLIIEVVSFDLHDVIEAVTDILYVRAKSKGLRLLVWLPHDLPKMVKGDPLRLRQILMNLVGNAIKFTRQGHVMIHVHYNVDADSMTLNMEIEDTGIGISPDKCTYIFDKFNQERETITREFGGTGLGLTISKKLVEMMNGSIGVSSVLGKGSVFWFSVRVENDSVKSLPAPFKMNICKARVLIFENYEPAQNIFADYFKNWEMKCDLFSDIQAAKTALVANYGTNDNYDIILINADILGDRLYQVLYDIPHNIRKSVIILLYASPDTDLEKHDLKICNIGGVIRKPVYPSHLYDILIKLWDSQNNITTGYIEQLSDISKPEIQAVSASSQFPETKILLVEDQPVNQLLMKTILSKAGCDTYVAYNGIEAIKMLSESEYDLVFMDCQMPEMDGFEATRQIRIAEQETKRHIPIIALTADAMRGDKDRCIEAGMDDYVGKPVKQEKIYDIIHKYSLHKNEQKMTKTSIFEGQGI